MECGDDSGGGGGQHAGRCLTRLAADYQLDGSRRRRLRLFSGNIFSRVSLMLIGKLKLSLAWKLTRQSLGVTGGRAVPGLCGPPDDGVLLPRVTLRLRRFSTVLSFPKPRLAPHAWRVQCVKFRTVSRALHFLASDKPAMR